MMSLRIILISCAAALLSAGERASAQRMDLSTLRLTTTIAESKYCRTDGEIDTLLMSAVVELSNVGTTDLFYFVGAARIGSLEIFPGVDAAQTSTPVYRLNLDYFGAPDPPAWSSLQSLKPGSAYRFKTELTAYANRVGYHGTAGLPPGKYRLRVLIGPTFVDRSARDEAEGKLRGRGILWSRAQWTEPMPFTIVKDRQVVDCPN